MGVIFVDQSIEVMTVPEVYQYFSIDLEKIARVCYKSEDKIKPGSDETLLNKIMANGHGSVLEHMNLTIKLITDRSVSHRMVRHRHCAFMQESTHYIDYASKGDITVVRQAGIDKASIGQLNWEGYMSLIADMYTRLSEDGVPHEVTASLLPQGLKTELIITTNLLEWQHIMRVRSTPKNHPQTRAMARLIILWFKNNLPFFVQDIEVPPEED